jgi:hypothetical protein
MFSASFAFDRASFMLPAAIKKAKARRTWTIHNAIFTCDIEERVQAWS